MPRMIVLVGAAAGATALSGQTFPLVAQRAAPAARAAIHCSTADGPAAEMVSRRSMALGALVAVLSPPAAFAAKTEGKTGVLEQDSNTAISANYYFPMAKYRYLPRIFRSWIAVDQLAPIALEAKDWEGLQEVWRRLDDATTAMPLYTNAAEGGARGTKKSKRSDIQKQMLKETEKYSAAVKDLEVAVNKKSEARTKEALAKAKDSLGVYRVLAKIDGPDGGCIQMPLGNAEEAGHGGAPLGYVVPAFRGGGISNDFSLRPGVEMIKNGVPVKDYRKAAGLE